MLLTIDLCFICNTRASVVPTNKLFKVTLEQQLNHINSGGKPCDSREKSFTTLHAGGVCEHYARLSFLLFSSFFPRARLKSSSSAKHQTRYSSRNDASPRERIRTSRREPLESWDLSFLFAPAPRNGRACAIRSVYTLSETLSSLFSAFCGGLLRYLHGFIDFRSQSFQAFCLFTSL